MSSDLLRCVLPADTLKRIVDAVSELVSEVAIECTSQGMSIIAMDATHVSLVAVTLEATGFLEYSCSSDATIGLSLKALQKIAKCAAQDDIAIISYNTPGDSTLNVFFDSKTSKRCAEFELKLMDIENDALCLPNREPDATTYLPSSEVWNVCKDLCTIGDVVRITFGAASKSVIFSTSGDIGKASITFKNAMIDTDITNSFSLRYIVSFLKGALAKDVAISMSNDFPLEVGFCLPDGLGSVRYFLAPKIDDASDNEDEDGGGMEG